MILHRVNVPFRGNYYEGKFENAASAESWSHVSPADIEDVISTPSESVEVVDSIVASARQSFLSWRLTPLNERIELLQRYRDIIKERADALALVLAREVGKPVWEARTEIGAMAGKVDISIKEGLEAVAEISIPNILADTNGYCRPKPLGVMAVIGPFNFPGHLPNGHIVPAILSGNTVVFKPSEKTPLIGQFMAECFEKAGFPPGVFNLLQGRAEVSQKLVSHKDVHGILFTGSFHVGQAIKKATMDQPWKLLALEMGGKNTAIVWDDAHLDRALFECISGAFMTSGQRCSATSKIVVHPKVRERFVSKFVEMAKTLKVGHPTEEVFMGSLIDGGAQSRYIKTVQQAQNDFEPLLAYREPEVQYQGAYVSPTVLFAQGNGLSNARAEFARSELFGPSTLIFESSDIDEAIEIANATEYGLVSSVFSQSEDTFRYCWNRLESGLINWNKSTVGASSKLPFGGIKQSGNHFPTALFASRYCTVPVTSMEIPTQVEVNPNVPGLSWKGENS